VKRKEHEQDNGMIRSRKEFHPETRDREHETTHEMNMTGRSSVQVDTRDERKEMMKGDDERR